MKAKLLKKTRKDAISWAKQVPTNDWVRLLGVPVILAIVLTIVPGIFDTIAITSYKNWTIGNDILLNQFNFYSNLASTFRFIATVVMIVPVIGLNINLYHYYTTGELPSDIKETLLGVGLVNKNFLKIAILKLLQIICSGVFLLIPIAIAYALTALMTGSPNLFNVAPDISFVTMLMFILIVAVTAPIVLIFASLPVINTIYLGYEKLNRGEDINYVATLKESYKMMTKQSVSFLIGALPILGVFFLISIPIGFEKLPVALVSYAFFGASTLTFGLGSGFTLIIFTIFIILTSLAMTIYQLSFYNNLKQSLLKKK